MGVMERIDQLVLMAPGGLQHVVSLGQSPLSVGRAPTNDLVLSNGHVSWNHLLLWVDGEGAWVKDLGSSNGTFVNDARSTGPTKLRTGDTLRVGTEFELKVGLREVTRREDRPRAYVVEAPELGVRVPIRSDRIGSAANCHLKVESLPPNAATLMVFDGGELSLGMNEEDHPIELGEAQHLGLRVKMTGDRAVHDDGAGAVLDDKVPAQGVIVAAQAERGDVAAERASPGPSEA